MLGAAGDVGSALTELAQQEGARVLGTASPGRYDVLRARGVEVVEDPGSLRERVDATFDPVGGPSLARSRRATRPEGIVVSYGFSSAVDAGASRFGGLARTLLALGRAKITPGPRCVLFQVGGQPARADLSHLIGLLAAGSIAPEVTTMPLAEAAEAHRRLEAREVVGKLVLVP